MLDVYTFGKTKAATVLARILSEPEYSKYISSVSAFLTKFNKKLNDIEISDIDYKTKEYVLQLIMKEFNKVIIKKALPVKLKSYIKNIFLTQCRAVIKSL